MLAFAVTGSSIAPTSGPPTEPDHGVNETTFDRLWSGDPDNGSIPADSSAMGELAAYVDIPFDAPPRAVDQWNEGDHAEFPETDWRTSAVPENTATSRGVFVRDAYVRTFAISPSTRAHLSPNETSLYVAPNGTVFATLDYRVDLPPSTNTSDERKTWSVLDTESEVALRIDNTTVDTVEGTATPTLTYAELNERPGTEHMLTVDAEITVTLEELVETRVEHCTDPDNESTCEEVWVRNATTHVETISVRDSTDVTAYELVASVRAVEYPNGDLGVGVTSPQPWQGFALENGSVSGSWGFYSARDSDWDTLERWQAWNHSITVVSPSVPLQVHAFPSPQSRGPETATEGSVDVLASDGHTAPAPSLPESIDLDVATGEFTSSDRIAVRDDGSSRKTPVVVHGLVRGVTVERSLGELDRVDLATRNLTVDVVEVSEDNVTLAVTLRDNETGAPISTDWTTGIVRVNGEPVQTNEHQYLTKHRQLA
ncbi:hypothetical protein SAMN05192554_1421 [Haloarchaeobius iranensis]|uniref:Uncharacterized protein n=2 Tax=Haloarchaeobius iranensis TaxID=996166 RepID=A0A1H0BJK5_9EURY|nr:hypothetical protein SAMN05192554_1421 [Haloarchaeobius iranensis]